MSPNELREHLGRYRELLVSVSRNGPDGAAKDEFRELRAILLGSPIARLLPDFVEDIRTPREFWPYIKATSPSYAGRAQHISEALGNADSQLRSQVKAMRGSPIAPAPDWEHVKEVWEKAIGRTTSDPEGAITAARSLLESVCKHILDERGVKYANDGDLVKLYNVTAKALQLAPEPQIEQAVKQVLSGCISVANGMAALRNTASDSHGKGVTSVKITPRFAELAVNAAGALSTFLIATFKGQP